MIVDRKIHLSRREVTWVSSTSPRCMVVYPVGKKSRQRVGIGGRTGTVSVFSVDNTMQCVSVFDTPSKPKPVSCVTLYEDQVFLVHGSIVEAYSRKGRLFFSFDTNLTEVIHTLFVSTPFIITCGSFMVSGFREANEHGFYMAPDRINAMAAFVATSCTAKKGDLLFDDYRCVLGCNDRTIRMLRSHKLLDETCCEAPISSLCVSDTSRKLFYGTDAGSLGCLDFKNDDSTLSRDFSHIPNERQAAVTALALYDMNMDGKNELLVGRQDGLVQVFSLSTERSGDATRLICIWSGNGNESVLSIAGGFILQSRRPDLLVHFFSGKITAFSLTEKERDAVDEVHAVETMKEATDAQTRELRDEIDALKRSLLSKTQELAECTGAAKTGTPLLAVSSTFTAKVTLSQQYDSPTLLLTVESDIPLDSVVLQSEVCLHFLKTELAEIVVQDKIPMNNPLTKTIAIIHPTEGNKHICAVAFWVEGGSWGLMKIITLPIPAPRTAQVKVIPLKPLPLYARVGGVNGVGGDAPPTHARMKVVGDYTAREMHSWLSMMLPGTPELYQPTLPALHYEDTFLHTTLEVKYGDGSATLTTDSLLVLTTAKRFLTYCASNRSLEVSFHVEVYNDAVSHGLERILPHIASCNKSCRDVSLLEALQQLQGSQEAGMLLSEEYRQLLDRADQLMNEDTKSMYMKSYLQKLLLSYYESVSDLVPHAPNMTLALKEALTVASNQSDLSEMTTSLKRLFLCDEKVGMEHKLL